MVHLAARKLCKKTTDMILIAGVPAVRLDKRLSELFLLNLLSCIKATQ
jgi:hypothetical protein